jgi:hypothetical protein
MPEHDVYEIVLDQTPTSLNVWQSLHWAQRNDLKMMWEWEIFAVAPRIPKYNDHINLSAVIWFATNRRRDVDNFASVLWKMTQDALVHMDIVKDDTASYISTGTVDLRIDPDRHEHTVIYLEVG